MKSLFVAALAAASVTFAAAPASAKYAGYYLATFTYPGASFQHCFSLTQTQQYANDGYKYSGTWVDTDYPNTSGTWAVYKDVIHLAGSVGGGGYLVLDGRVAGGGLHLATYDFFGPTGTYFAAGSFTETSDSACASASHRTPQ